jgi:hypothetical protein
MRANMTSALGSRFPGAPMISARSVYPNEQTF